MPRRAISIASTRSPPAAERLAATRAPGHIVFMAKSSPPSHVSVCSLSALPAHAKTIGATHLMTILREHTAVATPEGIAAERHLRIGINDINEPREGFVHPEAGHLEEIIAFARAWDETAPLLIHCWAGISRSTAAAFISLCTRNPGAEEARIAVALRAASPTATPNRLMVELADGLLMRRGRMVRAIEAIGPGVSAMEGQPFLLPSRF